MENLNFWLFLISFSCLLIFTLTFGLLGKTREMGIAILACAICMAFSQIDKIEFFKAAGFEARMKKYAEEASIKSLQKFTTSLASSVMDIIIAEGRAGGGVRWENKEEAFNNLLIRLKELGLNDDQIKSIKEKSLWPKLVLFDHVMMLLDKNLKKLPSNQYCEIKDKIFKDLYNHRTFVAAEGNEFRKLFKEHNLLTPEVEESIKDLEYFQAKKEIRRPEIWREFFDRVE